MVSNGLADLPSVIGPIGSYAGEGSRDLIKQRCHLRGIIGMFIRQRLSNDPFAGIYCQMKLSVAPDGPFAMLVLQPLTCTVGLDSSAVDQDIQCSFWLGGVQRDIQSG